jgi:hypothetical protein
VGAGVCVSAGPQAARTSDTVTSNIANIEKRFISFSISKVVLFCTYFVHILSILYMFCTCCQWAGLCSNETLNFHHLGNKIRTFIDLLGCLNGS